jgi:hydroxymethylglutaryl-CoA lyase
VVVISATEQHNMANVRRPIADSIADLGPILELSRTHGCSVAGTVAVAFGCPYQGEVSHKEVFRLVETYLDHGIDMIILGDTAGMATPTRVQNLTYNLNNNYQPINLALHFHNNRGTAMANLLAGLQIGIAIFDTALGGIGGCPYVPNATGNLATEDVVYMLEDMGIQTGIDLHLLIEAAHRLQDILGEKLPGQVMKSGPKKHTMTD